MKIKRSNSFKQPFTSSTEHKTPKDEKDNDSLDDFECIFYKLH